MVGKASKQAPNPLVRRLARADLAEVVAIDAGLRGHSRRGYFEKRLALALAEPDDHVQFAVESGGRMLGYVLARLLEGEFGRIEPSLRVEIIGVRKGAQGAGLGRLLHQSLAEAAHGRGIRELWTGASWRDHGMLRFLDGMGYRLAPSLVIECSVHEGHFGAHIGEPMGRGRGDPNDYSAPADNDFEMIARDSADVRSLAQEDIEAVSRIDRRITGHDRSHYMKRTLFEALNELDIRVSLTARKDGVIAGYIMAKTDFGDFGRTEPVAVIDTIGVDPDFAGRGIGRALLSQLFINLFALHVERVETVIDRQNFELLRFFHSAGFGPGLRLAFVKNLD